MVYMIGYDLNKAGKNYLGVIQAIKDSSTGIWMHYLESTWFIQSNLNAEKISNKIKSAADTDDCWIVCKVEKNYSGQLDSEAWPYLKAMFD